MVKKAFNILKWRFNDLKFNLNLLDPLSLVTYYTALFARREYTKIRINGCDSQFLIRVNNSIDRNVLDYVFIKKYHLPPKEFLIITNSVIVDLGSNIGATLIDLSLRYPDSKIIGYEMNRANFEIAEKNTRGFGNIKIIHQAIWNRSCEINYDLENQSDAFTVLSSKESIYKSEKVLCTTLPELFISNKIEKIDFLKMDIEGAELDIFDSPDIQWLKKVKSINIEFHNIDEIRLNKYIILFQEFGFIVYKSPDHWLSILAYKS